MRIPPALASGGSCAWLRCTASGADMEGDGALTWPGQAGAARAVQESADAGHLPADRPGDLLAECVSAADGQSRVNPALDFDPQGAPGPPGPRVRVRSLSN